ncbi:iron transporter [Motiliproteus sp. SC1-56]|uniref:iron transporter n=1 Tax=Motiliproteus sp. SC1-56 TaxID=2799565 RepID=UPI001A8DB71C|nr:iron transporter [Motiliproteus sp. SC1-56]
MKKTLALLLAGAAGLAQAAEFKVGEPVKRDGMELQILYIQAVEMSHEPAEMQMSIEEGEKGAMDHSAHGGHAGHGPADIHLEAAVQATAGNAWGFPEGAWVPYLNITYSVAKNGSYFKTTGKLIPMASNNGPHYGANLQLDGPGKYFVTYEVEPPKPSEFPYHTDAETGVTGWWKGFEIKDNFTYLGTGKKGGY